MKKTISILFLSLPYTLQAQFVVGTQGMTIKAYATVSIDSLILSPSSDITLSNNQLTRSSTNLPIGSGNSINRVYTFTSPITYSGNMGFRYSDAELAGNTENNLEIAYAAATTGSVWITTTGSMLNTTGNTILQNFNNTTVARITARSYNPLSVSLLDFVAEKDEPQLASLLSWEVANEKNLNSYEIERSTDGKSFENIGSVKAIGAANYQYRDGQPLRGTNYYRLQMLNGDGSHEYSVIRMLRFDKMEAITSVFPNPIQEETITVHTTDEHVIGSKGYVTDVTGKLITTFVITGMNTVISATGWAPGMYFIRIENGITFKVQKQ